MKIIKRSGAEAVFDISKIIIAINKANHEVVEAERLTADQIKLSLIHISEPTRRS